MLTILLFLVLLAVFEIAVLLWGVDSTDDINSAEWERRRWRGRFV